MFRWRVRCQLGTVASGTTLQFTIQVRPLAGGTLESTVGVTGTTSDPNPANNAAYSTTDITAAATTHVVTNTNDSGPGSLNLAILRANDHGPRDRITFDIPGDGPHTIRPATSSPLPQINQPVEIDGTTQPGYAGTPLIEISGELAGPVPGLIVNGANSVIRGLAINRFAAQAGIGLGGAGGHTIEASFLGTNTSGTVALPNRQGVLILSPNNVIGGSTASARNLISGNTFAGVAIANAAATGNLVSGNFIGTTLAGTAALPNGADGISVRSNNNTIGGAVAGSGNLISGNLGDGIDVTGAFSGNIVQGNRIGTNADGTAAIPNTSHGITLANAATNNTVGGTSATARNVLSGNGAYGVFISGAGTTVNRVIGNFIGTSQDGTAAVANQLSGVAVTQGAAGNIIGGTDSTERNIISGNTGNGVFFIPTAGTGNTVLGNYIGTNAGGTAALGNGVDGVVVRSSGNTIGGTTAGAGNVISGNLNDGVDIGGGVSGTVVQGNLIGTNADGSAALPNMFQGVWVAGGANNNIIGGVTAGARNVLSGNASSGVVINAAGTTANSVVGNLIGTNPAGTAAIPNQINGVGVTNGAAGNVIGGSQPVERNIISGNIGVGVGFFGTAADGGNTLVGNFIGTDFTGAVALGNNGTGVYVQTSNNSIGSVATGIGNTIANNGFVGVHVDSGTGNAIVNNRIFANASLGIDLAPLGVTPNDPGDGDDGPNRLLNFPVLSSARIVGSDVRVQVTLDATPVGPFTVHFYSNPACDASGAGEGQTPIGVASFGVSTDPTVTFEGVFPAAQVPAGSFLTATTTDGGNNTSEFSQCEQVDATAGTANLGIMMNDSPDPVTVDSPLTYLMTVSNSGPDAGSAVVVTDELPASLTFVSANASIGSCTGTSTVTCNLGTVAVGTNVTVSIVVTPTIAGTVSNTATVSAGGTDPNADNNSATVSTTVTAAGPFDVRRHDDRRFRGGLAAAGDSRCQREAGPGFDHFAIPGAGVRTIRPPDCR